MITINETTKRLIEGLDELLAIIPKDHNFHDAEIESFEWNMMKEEIIFKISDMFIDDKIYYITWHIKPHQGRDFQFVGSPYNTYIGGINIEEFENRTDMITFECDGSGLMVTTSSIRVTIEEIPQEDYQLWKR